MNYANSFYGYCLIFAYGELEGNISVIINLHDFSMIFPYGVELVWRVLEKWKKI